MFKTKEYFEFVEHFKTEVQKLIVDMEAKLEYLPANGSNENSEDILAVSLFTKEGTEIQNFYLEDLYQSIMEQKIGFLELMKQTKEILDICEIICNKEWLEGVDSYEKIKNHLIIRVLNYKRDVANFKNGIFYNIGDVVLTVYLDIVRVKDDYPSSMINSAALSIWGKRKNEVMETAIRNTYRLYPPRLFDAASSPGQVLFKPFMESVPDIDKIGDVDGTYITAANMVNGAVSIFLPGVAKRLGDLIGNDYYIGFICKDLVVVHNVTLKPEALIRGGLRLQNWLYNDDLYLSDKVYLYSREKEQIMVIG